MSSGQLAFDIETINPQLGSGEKPDFQNPEHFELFSLCCAYRSKPSSDIEHEVFFRNDRSAESELNLVEQALEWMLARDSGSIITYNGEYFDYTQFEGRARIASEAASEKRNIPHKVEQFLSTISSDDLKHNSWETFGEYTSFEETCEQVGVDVPRTMLSEYDIDTDDYPEHRDTANAMKPYFVGGDVPVVGERYLDLLEVGATDTKTFQELHQMLAHYATTDVVPLFELADERPFSE